MESKIKKRKEVNISNTIILLFVLYSEMWYTSFSILNTIFWHTIFLSGIILLLLLSEFYYGKNTIVLSKKGLIWGMFLMGIFFSIRQYANSIREDIIVFLICFLFLILDIREIDNYDTAFKFIKVSSVFFALGTIFQFISPYLYDLWIFPMFNEIGRNEILNLVKYGAYPGFTSQTAYTAGILVNALGIYFCMGSRSRKNIMPVVVILSALLLTGKRGHLIFMILSCIGVYYFSSRSEKKGLKIFKIILIFFLAGALFLLLVPYYREGSSLARIAGMFIDKEKDITSGRLTLYIRAWEMFMQNPFYGIGWRQFQENSIGFLSRIRTFNVHNVYLQLLCETGIIGTCLVIFPMGYTFICTIKDITYVANNKFFQLRNNSFFYIKYSLFLQLFFLLYSFTGNPLTDKCFFTIYILGCAIFYSCHKEIGKGREEINEINRQKIDRNCCATVKRLS
jgi:O-antigen ligase